MAKPREIGKFSIGIGDRFGKQGKAQLQAVIKAMEQGVTITPVWNKSFREHQIVGTQPMDVRKEADSAVKACGWKGPYFVDADHVGMKNVDGFIEASDFFTLDVADFIGQPAEENRISAFVERHKKFIGDVRIPGIDVPLVVSKERLETIARQYVGAVSEAGKVFQRITGRKPEGTFVVEVSMDETPRPQTPVELLFILAAIADEKIPARTVAPKFSGKFNKGVDYAGDVSLFAREFAEDLAVIAFAVNTFHLPETLKLSIHSGSDKFSIYGHVRQALKTFDAGVHLKTAGTTWLEELIGLADAGAEGLKTAKRIYAGAFDRMEELCRPYATVIDIQNEKLPLPRIVDTWDRETFLSALRHDPTNVSYNPHIRQLLHVAYKVAAEMGEAYLAAVDAHEKAISRNVTENLYERHIKRLFL